MSYIFSIIYVCLFKSYELKCTNMQLVMRRFTSSTVNTSKKIAAVIHKNKSTNLLHRGIQKRFFLTFPRALLSYSYYVLYRHRYTSNRVITSVPVHDADIVLFILSVRI